MKRLIFIAVTCSCLVIWLSGGCEKPMAENVNKAVIGSEQNKIPPEVAGTWQMRNGVWRMVIEPNGIVSSAIIPLMECTIRPNQTTKVEMKDGNFSEITAGNMVAEFKPENRELFVYIELKEFVVRFFEIRTGGNQFDTFTGPVSQDGSVWKPEWVSVFDYGPNFPLDANDIMPSPCIFDKVEETGGRKAEDRRRK